jgi:hypothetical protein
VKDVNVSVTALLKYPDGTGYHKHYKPGVYSLVEFVRILPGVSFSVTSAVTSGVDFSKWVHPYN